MYGGADSDLLNPALLAAPTGHYTLDGGDNRDVLDFDLDGGDFPSQATAGVFITLDDEPNDGVFGSEVMMNVLSTVEGVRGTMFNDHITGNHKFNNLNGRGGHDTLIGMGGADTLYGGAGDDQLVGGFGPDKLFGGKGNDLLVADNELPGRCTDWLDGGEGTDTGSNAGPDDVLTSMESVNPLA